LAKESEAAGRRVDGIGVGMCEIVDLSGRIASANCLDWPGDLAQRRLSRIAPTWIEADVRAAARAEAMFGAGKSARTFLYLSIGTGISSCLVVEGQPFPGAHGATGTMASGPLPGFNEAGTSVLLPSLEQVAAGPALVARFAARRGAAASAQDVLAAAAAGDRNAIEVARSAAEALGGGIGWLVNVLDPERVILGGGLGLSEGLFREALVASVRRHIWWEGHRDVPIVSAATAANAGIIGAAATAIRHAAEGKG
jgi:glucokinase